MSPSVPQTHKHMWQLLLGVGIVAELILIVLAIVSLVQGNDDIPTWQAMVFMAIAVWIYIAYLKQRTLDISKFVVDEKIKTHSLVQQLKEGLILIDANNGILLMNQKAAEITGLDELSELGQSLAGKVDPAIAARLNSDEAGEADGVVTATGRSVRFSILPLAPDNEGARNRMIYVARPVQEMAADKNVDSATAEDAVVVRAAGLLRQLAPLICGSSAGLSEGEHARRVQLALEAAAVGAALDEVPPEAVATQTFSIGPWLQELIRPLEPCANAVKVPLDVAPVAGQLKGNPALLGQVMQQILLTAVLASLPTGGGVRVRAMPMGGNLGLAVIDSGAPVPAGSLNELFARKYDGVTNAQGVKTRTSGAGLWRAREICLQQKGTLVASLHPDGGVCIVIMLPCAT